MKETKKQIDELILSIAQGSTDPTIFNQRLQTLSKLSNIMIDHIDEVETSNTGLNTQLELLTTDHDKLKQSYHEKWGSEDLNPDKDFKKPDEIKEYTDQDIIKELTDLSKTEGAE